MCNVDGGLTVKVDEQGIEAVAHEELDKVGRGTRRANGEMQQRVAGEGVEGVAADAALDHAEDLDLLGEVGGRVGELVQRRATVGDVDAVQQGAVLEQQLDDLDVAVLDGNVERRVAAVVAHVDVDLGADQGDEGADVAREDARVQRRLADLGAGVGACTALLEQRDDGRVAHVAGVVHGREEAVVAGLGLGAVREQQAAEVAVAVVGRRVQRRDALARFLDVDVGVVVQQLLDELEVGARDRGVERRAVGVGELVGIEAVLDEELNGGHVAGGRETNESVNELAVVLLGRCRRCGGRGGGGGSGRSRR